MERKWKGGVFIENPDTLFLELSLICHYLLLIFFDTVGPSQSSFRSVECNNVSEEEYLLIPILLRSDNDSRAKKVP